MSDNTNKPKYVPTSFQKKDLIQMYPSLTHHAIKEAYEYVRKTFPRNHLKREPNGLSPIQLKYFKEYFHIED